MRARDVRRPGRALAILGSLAILLCAFTFAPLAQSQSTKGSLPSVPPELKEVQAALAKYRDPVAAVRDGYHSTLGCIYYGEGGMGIHMVNMRLIGPTPDPMKPQVLLYEPDENGGLQLIAAEWFVPLLTGVKVRPSLFGQPFDGPMEGHYPFQPKRLHHYDLHVWLFKENPAGLFAETNPNVNCIGKPYAHRSEHPKIVPHN